MNISFGLCHVCFSLWLIPILLDIDDPIMNRKSGSNQEREGEKVMKKRKDKKSKEQEGEERETSKQ